MGRSPNHSFPSLPPASLPALESSPLSFVQRRKLFLPDKPRIKIQLFLLLSVGPWASALHLRNSGDCICPPISGPLWRSSANMGTVPALFQNTGSDQHQLSASVFSSTSPFPTWKPPSSQDRILGCPSMSCPRHLLCDSCWASIVPTCCLSRLALHPFIQDPQGRCVVSAGPLSTPPFPQLFLNPDTSWNLLFLL